MAAELEPVRWGHGLGPDTLPPHTVAGQADLQQQAILTYHDLLTEELGAES